MQCDVMTLRWQRGNARITCSCSDTAGFVVKSTAAALAVSTSHAAMKRQSATSCSIAPTRITVRNTSTSLSSSIISVSLACA